jgi:hypothetical protein
MSVYQEEVKVLELG